VVARALGDTATVRRALVQYLAGPFGGDELVAEYVLLHLLSGVRGRVDGQPLGRLLLNVTGCPRASVVDVAPQPRHLGAGPPLLLTDEQSTHVNPCSGHAPSELGHAVHATLAQLLPRSVLLTLALDVLNRTQARHRLGTPPSAWVGRALIGRRVHTVHATQGCTHEPAGHGPVAAGCWHPPDSGRDGPAGGQP
jgi:hypothetical protein